MFNVMRKATKTADLAISALEQSLIDLDDYEDNVDAIERAMTVAFQDAVQHMDTKRSEAEQRLGTKNIVWVGPYTISDGRFISGYGGNCRDCSKRPATL